MESKTAIMGVVKADAYGHGILQISKVLIDEGIEYLAVACIEEAMEIREKFQIPILVLGFVPYSQIQTAIKNNITLTVYNEDIADYISQCAQMESLLAKIHIKIDTGMNRLGFQISELDKIRSIASLRNLTAEGIFTHFSSADTDNDYTREQFISFSRVCDELSNNFKIKYRHCCNSAALIKYKHMHMDMVRPGIILYDSSSTSSVDGIKFMPVSSLQSTIIHLKEVERGARISYGGHYVCNRNSLIATVPVGYADGLHRVLSNNCSVLVNGQFCEVIGNICMDQCMIDVTDVPNVKLFDTVVFWGESEGKQIYINEISTKANTIDYEILCSVSKRVPRVYISKQIDE